MRWYKGYLFFLFTFSTFDMQIFSEEQNPSSLNDRSPQPVSYHPSHPVYHKQKLQAKKKETSLYREAYYLQVEEYIERKGLSFSGNYVADIAGNPVGGKARGFKYAGSVGMFFNLDLEKIFEWKGFDFYFSATWRKGSSLSKDKIGNIFDVMQVYGSETLQLSDAALKYESPEGLFSWYGGRIGAGDFFLSSPYYSYYVNNAIDGNPVAIFFNLPFSAYPNALWGSLIDLKGDFLELKLGVFDTNYEIFHSKYHGLNFSFKSPYGVLLIAEGTLLVGQSPKSTMTWPGNYKFGVAYVTGQHDKISGKTSKGDINYYLLFDQVFFKRNAQQYGAFISLILAEPDKNTFPFFLNGGMTLKGLIPSREKDVTCLGFAYGDFSKDIRRNNKINHQPLQHAETDLECNYTIFINPNNSIQPCIQYVIHPNGQYNIPNALVFAVQATFGF